MSNLFVLSEKDKYENFSTESFLTPEEKNHQYVRYLVNKDNNPNPIVITVIIVVIMVMLYYIYVSLIKQCYSGAWVSSDGNIVYIVHNKWNDSILVDDLISGKANGGSICLQVRDSMYLGTFYDGSIYWVNGGVWRRPQIIE